MFLKNKKIAFYVTGGIAIYKAVDLMRTLIKKGAQVQVAMTPAACEFVSPLLFEKLSKHEVLVDTFTESHPETVAHIDFATHADFAIVAPATANTLAKMAHGLADNMVTSALLATTCPIFTVPAMNENMYQHPATQENITTLANRGVYLMTPDRGFLAEGYEGQGRFPEKERIVEEFEVFVRNHLANLPLADKKVLITAGGTQEALDPVRVLTNRSSGKMGHALATAAFYAGAEVTLVTASALPVHSGIKTIRTTSARDMYRKVAEFFDTTDVLIMAAAVSDYYVKNRSDQKMKKKGAVTLELAENPDILKAMGQKKKDQFVIGFAAETEHLETYAAKKLAEKNLDAIIANSVAKKTSGFDVDENAGVLMTAAGSVQEFSVMSKQQMAEEIIDYIANQLD